MAMYGFQDKVRAGVLDGLDHDFVSKRATAVVQFGDPVFVALGNETDIVAPDFTNANLRFQGVAVIAQQSTITQVGEYPINEVVSVCNEGEIWVAVPDALTACANKPAFVTALIADPAYKKFNVGPVGTTMYDSGCTFTSNPITLGTGKTYAKVDIRGLK
jgi:hypothetical protein